MKHPYTPGKWIVVCFLVFLVALLPQFGTPTSAHPAVSPIVVDFENIATDGLGTGDVTVVNDQYANEGITFEDPVALDFSKGLAIPGFAHSGTKAIETCYGAEFCTATIGMRFTQAQRRVKLWVGFSSSLGQSSTVALTVYDNTGAQVGQVTTTLAPSTKPIPIQTPLEVNLPAATIFRAEVGFVPPDPQHLVFNNDLAVDDVEFDTAGGPPPCTGTGIPVVTLNKPTAGANFQINEFEFQATVSSNAPLTSVMLTSSGPGGSATLPLLSAGVGDNLVGTFPFGPIRVDGALFPGTNTLTLTATSCRGSNQASTTVTYTPIANGTRFTFMGMEVNQAIQNLNNSVTLLANKRTVVRVYLRLTGPTTSIHDVSARLSATFVDGLNHGVTNIVSSNKIMVDSSTDINAKRRDINASFNFELPSEWIVPGVVHFEISSLYIEDNQTLLPCDGCDNVDHSFLPIYVHFVQAPAVRVKLENVTYTETQNGTSTSFTPRAADDSLLISWLKRAYPTDQVLTSTGSITNVTGTPDKNFTCNTINATLGQVRAIEVANGVDSRTKYYGLVSDSGGFMRGCSPSAPSTVGSGPSGTPASAGYNWDTDASFADWYGGHELGHQYGRKHPGYSTCSSVAQGKDDPNYPYAGGLISGPDLHNFGFDTGDSTNNIQEQVYAPDVWSDVMTYNCNVWISDYTYLGILQNLKDLEKNQSSSVVAKHSSGNNLLVSGTINLTKETAQLLPFLRLPNLQLTARPEKSKFSIELFDGRGTLLARYPFNPGIDTDIPPGEDIIGSFNEVVPFVQGTRRIVIAEGDEVFASRIVSKHTPETELIFPNGGEKLQGPTVTVTWKSRDVDGGALTYDLFYSTDAGKTWQMVAMNIQDTHYTVKLNELPGGDRSLFRVITTDGVNTSIENSDHVFSVPATAPQVTITSPSNKSSFTTDQTIVFTGSALDLKDGPLGDTMLKWSSDKQGVLGTGHSLAVTGLKPGLHTITLEATNSSGLVGKATIQVQINAPLPVIVVAYKATAAVGSTVDLDASKSHGFGPLAYHWEIVSKPQGSAADIVNALTARPSFVPDKAGAYVIRLTITDTNGGEAIDFITIKAV